MNRLEEIQEIIKNFIYEKQQMKQEITEIERKRTQLAEERNEKKSNINKEDANAIKVEAEISELGKQIAELGNQSQELQNKLDSKFISVKNDVNIQIDNLISEGIRRIRKIEEVKEEMEAKISNQESRNSKYEIQKQEFFARFGRMPELSENAQKENKIQEEECEEIRAQISEIESQIQEIEEGLAELAKNKREFKNGNWSFIVEDKQVEQEEEQNLQQIELEVEETQNIQETVLENEEAQIVEENIEIDNLDEIVNLVEDIIEEQKNNEQAEEKIEEKHEEEAIVLPFIEEPAEETVKNIEEVQIEEIEPIEEIQIEDIEPIPEINIEEFQPVEEVHIEELQPIEEIKVEEFEPIEDVQVENIEIEAFDEIPEIEVEEFKSDEIDLIAKIEEMAKELEDEKAKEENITEEVNVEQNNVENIIEEANKEQNKIENIVEENKEPVEIENAIITEEKEEAKEVFTFGEKVTITNIIAKFEEGEVLYKAQLSNGKTIKVYPAKQNTENLLLKDKENREELKEILINYAIAEYKILDKKVIKKIDPIVCEVLVKFAKEYNYDTQNLIYNYAMSFSKNEEVELDAIPKIIYNFSFIEDTKLSKKEKEILIKICKNARKNEKIEIIGYSTGLNKIKYIFKRTFNLNDAKALPEGKY